MKPPSLTTVLPELVQRIRNAVPETVRIVLFGSAARGELTPDSDVDVLVVIPSHLSEKHATVNIYRHLRGFPYPVDVIVVTTTNLQRYALRPGTIVHPALREGREIYGSDFDSPHTQSWFPRGKSHLHVDRVPSKLYPVSHE